VRGSPVRSHHGGAALVVMLATLTTAALSGAAVAPARAAGPVPADSSVTPVLLHFGEMDPGSTEVRFATLTTDAPDDAAIVRALVSGTGELADHLTTQVQVCAVPWTGAGCSAGGSVVVAGDVGEGVDTTLEVPVPDGGVAHLRVSLSLDETAPARSASTISYELHLVAPDVLTPTPEPSPTPGPGPGPDPDPGPGPAPGPLPVTGAEALSLGGAALALVALGLTLRTWARERRRATVTRGPS
jgi:hypothetical protein